MKKSIFLALSILLIAYGAWATETTVIGGASGAAEGTDVDFTSVTVGAGTAADPSVAFGDGDTGFHESSDDVLDVSLGGINRYSYTADYLFGTQAAYSIAIRSGLGTASNANYAFYLDGNTGMYSDAADQLSLAAGGVDGLRLIEDTGVLQMHQVTAGITADTGSSQGDGPLTSSYNEISVCANAGDAVTVPSAAAGYKVTIMNNGAQAADVFPASGDDLGAGADTAVSLASGSNITYFAYDATNWESM